MIAAILLVIFTTGVSGNADKTEDTEAEEQKIIGASFASEHASYQQALGNLLEAEAQKNTKYKLDIHYAGWSVSEQEEQIETFIKEGVDAIILCPVNAKSFLNILKDARKAGIPVINLFFQAFFFQHLIYAHCHITVMAVDQRISVVPESE